MTTGNTSNTEGTLYGCTGNLLRVDPGNGAITTERLDETIRRRYLGGTGFVTCFPCKELEPGIDPLGPVLTRITSRPLPARFL